VEGVDEVLGVAEVLGGFPGPTRDRPILPMDKILELAIVTSGVEDGFDFKFVTVNNGWCRGVLHAAGDVVGAKRLEQGDVALAEVGELDRIAVGDVDEAVEVDGAVAQAESYEPALGIVVSGDVGVAKEREEGWIALLGGADVAEKHGLVGDGSGHGSELELVRAEQCAGWCF